MNKKAQSLVEICMIAMLVGVVTISAWAIYNHQKNTLAGMSKSTIGMRSVNLTELEKNPSDTRWNNIVPYNKVETAGAFSILGGLTSGAYNALMSSITYAQLEAVLSTEKGKDLLTLANELKNQISLTNSELNLPPAKITKDDINTGTLSTLTKLLNAIETKKTELSPTEKAYIAGINTLIEVAKANVAVATTTTTAGTTVASTTPTDRFTTVNTNLNTPQTSTPTNNLVAVKMSVQTKMALHLPLAPSEAALFKGNYNGPITIEYDPNIFLYPCVKNCTPTTTATPVATPTTATNTYANRPTETAGSQASDPPAQTTPGIINGSTNVLKGP